MNYDTRNVRHVTGAIMDYKGTFTFEQIRDGVVIAKERFSNLIITEGVASIWDTSFGGGVAIDPWYIGLINNSPAPTILVTDTLASHANWTEFIDYTGTRQEWVDAATVGRLKGTSSAAAFPILGTATLYGMFIASVTSGTVGVIWSEGAFASVKPVIASDVINATYEIEFA